MPTGPSAVIDYPRVSPSRRGYKPPRKEPKDRQAQQCLHDLVQADKLRPRPKINLARLRNRGSRLTRSAPDARGWWALGRQLPILPRDGPGQTSHA